MLYGSGKKILIKNFLAFSIKTAMTLVEDENKNNPTTLEIYSFIEKLYIDLNNLYSKRENRFKRNIYLECISNDILS